MYENTVLVSRGQFFYVESTGLRWRKIMLTIRQAVYKDIANIMQFIDENWKKGHILARDREFFEWQFVENNQVNVFLGIDDETGKIYGMQGVIRYNHSLNPDVTGSIWKAIKSSNPKLGMDISDYSTQQLNVRYIIGAGVSEKAIRLGRILGGTPIAMEHYYRLGNYENYRIAVVKNKKIPEIEDTGFRLEPILSSEEMKQIISPEALATHIMSKDYAYIQWRYFEHPIYQYDVWKILNKEKIAHSVLITREESARGRKIGKIIDFYGDIDDLGQITYALDGLIKEKQYEYIDVYSYGVPSELYERAGLISCDITSDNIIPNYFHPFEQKNIDLKMMDPMLEGLRMFRGDGDQDRPC